MNTSTSHDPAVGNSLVKVSTLIAVVAAIVMVAAGVYGEAARRGLVVQPTAAATGNFDPCNADDWGRDLPIQVKMQFRKQCEEHRIR